MVSKKVTWGLLAAWVVHDLEELVTTARWTRRQPRVPTTTAPHAATAIGLVGVVVAAAAADGARTGGRSPFFQAVLTGFGLHSVTHVLGSAVFRGYTPGVVTAPVVVAPFSVWAIRQLRRAGIRVHPSPRALIWFPVTVGAAHAIARLVTRAADRPHSMPGQRP
ncbi:HXXEE domain-containing protein [Saccharothrix syringae]|uniref:HXXEE domain-containing protein n=1 Tax=Saccharothrix syringae TaxID=103733 RepID=A0A5Q0H8Y2_SACSY|nr:HXXEE domain-containing protein [Saccharothrix syringae]QFZ22671.1 HXXEE domain-containing protein [Saccharothrix syringae]